MARRPALLNSSGLGTEPQHRLFTTQCHNRKGLSLNVQMGKLRSGGRSDLSQSAGRSLVTC